MATAGAIEVSCAHAWKRVPPFVVTVLDEPEVRDRLETYNAECSRCGARAWLHWPEPVYKR